MLHIIKTTLCAAAATVMLAACNSAPSEVNGYSFTNDGIFGNIPSLSSSASYEYHSKTWQEHQEEEGTDKTLKQLCKEADEQLKKDFPLECRVDGTLSDVRLDYMWSGLVIGNPQACYRLFYKLTPNNPDVEESVYFVAHDKNGHWLMWQRYPMGGNASTGCKFDFFINYGFNNINQANSCIGKAQRIDRIKKCAIVGEEEFSQMEEATIE